MSNPADIVQQPELTESAIRDALGSASDEVSLGGQDLVDVTNITATGLITANAIDTAGYLYGGELSITGLSQHSGAVVISGTLTPTALSGDVNDYSPLGINNTSILLLSGGAAHRNITGINSDPVVNGRLLILINIGATNNLVLVHGSSSSTAEYRFVLPGGSNVTLTPGQTARLWWDENAPGWRVI